MDSRILQMIVFITLLTGTLLTVEYFAFSGLLKIFRLWPFRYFWLILILLTLLFPVSNFFSHNYFNFFSRSLYIISGTYIASVLIIFDAVILYQIINWLLPTWEKYLKQIFIISLPLLFIFSFYSAHRIKITHLEFRTSKIKQKYRLVQISDLHIGGLHRESLLEKVVESINELNADGVAITGDMLDDSGEIYPETIASLHNLHAPAYLVTGNHENYVNPLKLQKILEFLPVQLINSRKITPGPEIIGIPCVGHFGGQKEVDMIENLNPADSLFTVVLCHFPVDPQLFAKTNADLMLSGHTHGGQIFPFTLLTKFVFPVNSGLLEKCGKFLYVSPGTGTWGAHLRLGTFSEITVIDILPEVN